MNRLISPDIILLFEKIATLHEDILHDANDDEKKRFWRFNWKEFLTLEKSVVDFETMLLGLSAPGKENVTWNYGDTGTVDQKHKFFDVTVLGKIDSNDFDMEETICAKAEKILDDIRDWQWFKTMHISRCEYPILEKIDLANCSARRITNVGIGGYVGATMRLHLRDMIQYNDDTNSLTAMNS